MIAVVYGLQVRLYNRNCNAPTNCVFLEALIFIIRREFMLVGWMIVYLISYVLQLRNEALGADILTDIQSTASYCPYIPSGVWTNLDGVIRV